MYGAAIHIYLKTNDILALLVINHDRCTESNVICKEKNPKIHFEMYQQ